MIKTALSKIKSYFPALKRFLVASLFLYTIFSFIAKGILQFIFNRILIFAGITGLTKDNLLTVIKEPLALLFFCLFLLLASIFIIFEFIILTLAVTDQWRLASLKVLAKRLPKKLKQLLSWQLLIVISYLFLMIPLENLGLTSALLNHLKIPDFISGEITKTQAGTVFYWLLIALVAYLNIRLITFLPQFGLTDDSPKDALLFSWKKANWLTVLKRLTLIMGATLAVFILLTLTITASFILFNHLDPRGSSLTLETLFYSLISFLRTLLTLSLKFVLVLEATRDLALPTDLLMISKENPPRKRRWLTVASITAFAAVYLVLNMLELYLVEQNPNKVLIAHRGNVKAGVENSIEAMKAANKAGANYSELDVVMTKDKQFAVIHDNHLKRLAGLDKNVSDMTLADLKKLTLHQGSFTSHIASLEEFLQAAKSVNQALIIELKPYGHEPKDYVERFLRVLRSQNALTRHKVMSLNLGVIEKVERLAPQVSTGYLIPFNLGPVSNYKVDFYAVEEFSYNNLFALSAENQDKDVYVWTVNDESLLQSMLLSASNGVITDELKLFSDIKKDMKEQKTYLDRALRLFNSYD